MEGSGVRRLGFSNPIADKSPNALPPPVQFPTDESPSLHLFFSIGVKVTVSVSVSVSVRAKIRVRIRARIRVRVIYRVIG